MDEVICNVCQWRIGYSNLITTLGDSPVCIECFEARAETPEKIHEATSQAKKGSTAEAGLKEMLRDATIWRGQDIGYISLSEYHATMSRQQLVLIDGGILDPEEEDLFLEMNKRRVEKYERIHIHTASRRPPSGIISSIMAAVIGLFVSHGGSHG